MKKYFFLFFLIASSLLGQSKTSERAELYFQKQQFALALEELENMSVLQLNDRLRIIKAICFYNTKQFPETYRLLHHVTPLPDSLTHLYLDVCKKSQEKQEVQRAFELLSKDTTVSNSIKRKYDAIPLTSWEVRNMISVNTEYGEIAPMRFKNGMVFSSNRENTIIERKTGALYQPAYDLYLAEGDSLMPRKIVKFSAAINSKHHECCATFTSNFDSVFYARTYDYSGIGGKNTVKLFSAINTGGGWEEKFMFRFNDTTHSYSHPALDARGEMFFFASDRVGGYGGTDLYVSFREGEIWSEPVNLGPGVNSSYNELYPYFGEDSVLYFSSNRPEGLGGYDVYEARETEDGDYAVFRNVGIPVNSPFDEYSFYISVFGYGYFSSNRPGGKGLEDVYFFRIK